MASVSESQDLCFRVPYSVSSLVFPRPVISLNTMYSVSELLKRFVRVPWPLFLKVKICVSEFLIRVKPCVPASLNLFEYYGQCF
jgi:hypothetical protein